MKKKFRLIDSPFKLCGRPRIHIPGPMQQSGERGKSRNFASSIAAAFERP